MLWTFAIVPTPVYLTFVPVNDESVEIPLKFADVPASDVKVLIPGAFNPVVIPAIVTLPTLMLPNVEKPETFRVVL